jgi:putative inorganic carbon (hco3(-)) transporter
MRDYVIVGIVIVCSLAALRRPWIGVLLWAWVSLMNPHRFAWGFAYDFPVALLAAVSTLVGLMLTKDRETPFKGTPPVLLALFMVWITISWLMGLDPNDDRPQWDKVMKIMLMVLIGISLIRTKYQIMAYAWVCTMSLALLGAKGGLFTLTSGGGDRVYGPEGSFIAENNALGLALVVTIPMLRFLQMQLTNKWGIRAITVVMVLVAASALGSHSRGALLAISGMTLLLWWRGKNRWGNGVAIVLVAVALLAFMPENWTSRMSTISDEQQDDSVMGRFSAWWVGWRIGLNYPFGVGFNASRPELFAAYSPYPQFGTPAAHSVYFQVLGHHGFIGLFIYLALWGTTWRAAARLRSEAAAIPEAKWCADLAAMSQVALFGFFIGGTFLSLSYFDLPYNIMALIVLARFWVTKKRWQTDTLPAGRWRSMVPGLALPSLKR